MPQYVSIPQLVSGAEGSVIPLSSLLRSLLVIATRLGVDVLEDWVGQELRGYPADSELPGYRQLPAQVNGLFFHPGLGQIGLTPQSSIPDEYWRVNIYQSVTEIEMMAIAEHPQFPWPADVTNAYNRSLSAPLRSAWRTVGNSALPGLLDQVRVRVLCLALTLEKAFPDDGNEVVGNEELNQKLTIQILGNNNIVQSGGTSTTLFVTRGDREGLENALVEAGLRQTQVEPFITELDALRDLSGAHVDARSYVRKFLGAAGGIASRTTEAVLVGCITQYLGS